MAGNPQKRLRRITEALEAKGIDPATLETATPTPTPTRNTTRARTVGVEDLDAQTETRRAPARAPARVVLGPATRHESDRRAANDLSELADQLAPGLTVRLERTRPTWAAGWVEDLMIDDHDLGAVLEYIASEHGGQMYRASVITIDGQQLYTARIPVAGPPRRQGRLLARSYWDGSEPEQTRAPNPTPTQHAPAFDLAAIVDLIGKVNDTGRERQDTLIQSVREMNAQSQRTTSDMLKALMAQREDAKQSGGLREQLRELVQATHAIEEVREVLGQSTQQQNPSNDDDRSGMNKILETAAAEILKQGLQNDAARTSTPPSQPNQPPPGFRRVQVQPRPTNGHAQPKAPTT